MNSTPDAPTQTLFSPAVGAKTDPNRHGQTSYGQVLKSSTLIGVSSLANVALGIVRTKVFALLLGPAGIGLLGLYSSVADLARSLAGLGVNSSGVRQIAEAVGTGDTQRIACTVTTLRRVALCFGALGSLLLLVFSKQVARVTFGDDRHAGAVALLSLAVLFGNVSAAQGALVQGMRRIADLARISVLGALYGTLFSIPIVYFFGERGLVPSLVCVAGMSILTSWWYARKVQVERVKLSVREIVRESSGLLKLGLVFMASSLMLMGSAYLVRIILLRQLGFEAAGYYQAAWALGGLYVGFILNSMGADFYPRLTAVASNNAECNRLVNEQAEVGLLLAGPGVIGTLVFSPLVIALFYSGKFGPAVEILRWFCLGMILRVASWPMGYILLAKGAAKVFFWTELVANALQVGLVYVSVQAFGLMGAGLGFFGMYVFYLIGIYLVVRRLSGFRWSAANRRVGLLFFLLIAAVFLAWYMVPRTEFYILGVGVTVCGGLYSLRHLRTLVPLERLLQAAQKLLRPFVAWKNR
jgi:PST family polysaccharide transporter